MTDNFLAQEFGKSQYYTDIKISLFKEHGVKKGLRNEDGTGVRVGLTRVSDVVGYDIIDGVKTNIDGYLYYRGYSLNDLVEGNIGNTNGFDFYSVSYPLEENWMIFLRFLENYINYRMVF